MARVTISIPHSQIEAVNSEIRWNQPQNLAFISLGQDLSEDGSTDLYLGFLVIPRIARDFAINLHGSSSGTSGIAGPDFSTQMESEGTITCRASNGDEVIITGISDASEPYRWRPSNLSAINTFANALAGLTDRTLTVVFDDRSIPTMKYNGVGISAWKYNGVEISAAKYNGVVLQ